MAPFLTCRTARRCASALLLGTLACLLSVASASAAELRATPSNFGSVFAAAQAGDTILLAAGDYGAFAGGGKPGMVTIRPEPGAGASMRVNFRGASNITLDGLSISGLEISDRAHDIVVRNSRFDGSQATIRTGQLVNANILFEGNVHEGFNAGGGGGEGRIFLPEKTSEPSGVTIRASRFIGGNSDGIQNGGRGVHIINNEFTGIQQIDGAGGVHADSIQLYGSAQTVIRGNYFHDVAVGIMCADGCDSETVEDNVFAVNGSPYAITWLSDRSSVIRHNTFVDHGTCDYGQPCGIVYLGNKDADPPSSGTVLKDNIITRVCVCDGSVRGTADESHNLYTRGEPRGPSDLRGQPVFVGGAAPTSLAGYALAPGSPGKGTASDGTDRGARVTVTAVQQPGSPGSGSAGPGTSANGLVAAYGFGERKGRRTADASGARNRGVIRGADRIRAGRHGRALRFDGRGDVVAVADSESLDLGGAMTLEAWVRPQGRRSGRAVLTKKRRGGVSYALYAGDRFGRPAALATTKPKEAARGPRKLRRGRWSHLSVTFDGGAMRLFVNGKAVAEKQRTAPLRAGGGPLRIGAGPAGRHFKGVIDDVRVYNRALSPDEIRADMARGV